MALPVSAWQQERRRVLQQKSPRTTRPQGLQQYRHKQTQRALADSTCKMMSELTPPYVSVRKSFASASFQTCTGYVSPPWRRQTQVRP